MMGMGSSIGYAIMAAVCFAAPILVYLRAKRYDSAMIIPVIVGAIFYFLSTRMCDLTVWITLSEVPMSVKIAASSELVAVFEETARWLAMKYPVTNIKTSRAAFCYGIGHGGLECFIRGGIAIKLISQGRDMGLLPGVMGALNMTVNLGVHIALSLLIFKKMQEEKFLKWLGLAILLHYGLNSLVFLISYSGSESFTGFAGIFFGVVLILIVYKIIDGENVLTEIRYHTDDI